MENNSLWTGVGILAAALTATSFIPQLLFHLRQPHKAHMAYGTLATFILGAALWTTYGVYRHDWIIIGANIFILFNLLVIIIFQFIHEKIEKDKSRTGKN